MFVVIDLVTGVEYTRVPVIDKALQIADRLTDVMSYDNGHEYGVFTD